MAELQGFLKEASASLGVSTDSVQSATGAILDLIQQQAGKSEASALVDKIPGAASLLKEAPAGGGLGGMIGGLGKSLSGSLGGKLGGAATVLTTLQGSGLDLNQSGKFVSMFFDFAKSQAGSGVVNQILSKMPEIKKLIG